MGSELQSPDDLQEVYGRGRPGGYREENGHSLKVSSKGFAAVANKYGRTTSRGTPPGCWPACHTARADGEKAGSPVPSLVTAFREQLRLGLKSQKSSVEVLVIDSLQKPSEN